MQYRVDPRTGRRLSVLGLGCMRFPGSVPGRPDQRRAEAIIARAVERGVNYLDTAYLYPGNEAVVGAALEHLGLRDQVFLATKLPHASCKDEADLDRIFNEQLRRLRTDRIDYYLIHNITSPAQWTRLVGLGIEAWIARQKAAGRIGAIGFSYHGSAGDFSLVLDAYDFVMEPLLGGRLAGKLPASARRIFDQAADRMVGEGPGAVELTTPAAWGLSWVWDHPEVTMVLSGMTAPEMVDENARIATAALPGALSAAQHEAVARVLQVFERSNRVPCTGCNYCMPCPRGINIPGCFAAYNASFAHSWFTGVSQYFTASAVRTGSPKLASNCVRCGACLSNCPQHIEIPDRLLDVQRRLTPGPIGTALKLIARRKG